MTETLPPPTFEAPRSASKPLWKKKKFFIPVGVVGALFAIAAVAPSSDEQPGAVAPTTEAEIAAPIVTEAPVEAEASLAEAPVATEVTPVTEATTTVATIPPTTAAPAPQFTASQTNALRQAESYLDFQGFSRQGLIDQLSSPYGSQFPVEDATWAVDQLGTDWNEQAVRAGQSYLDFQGFSRQGLIDQLSSEFGSQFTVEQATFAADTLGL